MPKPAEKVPETKPPVVQQPNSVTVPQVTKNEDAVNLALPVKTAPAPSAPFPIAAHPEIPPAATVVAAPVALPPKNDNG